MKYFSQFNAIGLSIALTVIVLFTSASVPGQKMDGIERDRMKSMLSGIKGAIKKGYYDPNFRGIDLEARFKQAENRLGEVTTTGQALGVIAQALMDFNDSHLYFLPPSTNYRVEYGYRLRMNGDRAFVTAVKPGSKAEAAGLKIGDEVLGIEGFRPTRKDMWKMEYFFNVLSKRQKIKLTVARPGETATRDIEFESEVKKLPAVIDENTFFRLNSDFETNDNQAHLFRNVGSIAIWRMPSFDLEPGEVDMVMKDKIGNASSLIIDLRSNGGGSVAMLERLVGWFFDRDVKIADRKGRKPMDPMLAKAGKNVFKGKVVVLLSSESGSASEIFARVMQLEKRATVIGDTSAGAVMQAIGFAGSTSNDTIRYGAMITNADVIMSDGKSIENVGVVPDETIIPSGEDLAKGRDPVLARAVALLGGQLAPEEGGKFFPFDWSKK